MTSSSEILRDILDDSTNLSSSDRAWIEKFANEVHVQLNSMSNDSELSMFAIAERIHLDLSVIPKEGPFMCALWVVLLSIIREQIPDDKLKYPTLHAFLEQGSYERFHDENDTEQYRLWQTANWMFILFQMIPAKKNKGLAIQVIPKLVEGWHAKYVTGSGQTRLTANRVHIFETEGNVKASHRGKLKPKKRITSSQPIFKRQSSAKRGRKRNAASIVDNFERSPQEQNENDFELFHTEHKRTRFHSNTNSSHSAGSGAVSLGSNVSDVNSALNDRMVSFFNSNENDFVNNRDKALEEVDQKNINVEMKEAFKLLRDQSCSKLPTYNYPRGESLTMELLRSSSALNFGPSALGRGISWSEIPVLSSSTVTTTTSSTTSANALMAPPSAPLSQYSNQDLLLTTFPPDPLEPQSVQELFQGYAILSPPIV